MNNIEKIKAEIERLMKETDTSQFGIGGRCMCRIILDFIDSLPEEKPSEDLNKLIQKWDRIDINTVLKVKVKTTGKVIDGFYDGRGHFDHFIDHDVFDRYPIDEVELMPDEEPSDELEEAANEYAILDEEGKWKDGGKYKGFIAGAEWRYQKDRREFAKLKAKEWSDGYDEGIAKGKEKMMKDAVEGEVIYDLGGFFRIKSEAIDGAKYKVGSWVKLIIVKED